ncbi:MAG: MBL fold metallo-hydrolase [Clostridia bacterium]|nr:MBL fold metallo-hydrolase [Clostridia bacterium]
MNGLLNRFNLVSNSGNLLVHFIDVGQGDAIAINLPDGKVMLIDNGDKDANVTYTNYLKENVLNSKMRNEIDYLVLTHADSDHIGGTMKLLQKFKINTVFMPKITPETQTFEEIFNFVDENCKYKTLGEEFEIVNKDYKFTFFEILNGDNTNDSSQLIKLEYMNKSFLFTGDISSEVEDDYISTYGQLLDIDVLKISHHGSSTATSAEFLEIASPNYAVISVGEDNSYDHPNIEVVDLLKSNKIEIKRTDKQGDILFVLGKTYGVKVLSGDFYITNLTLNYTIYIIIIDGLLIINIVFILIKNDKKKKNKRKTLVK